MPFRLTHNMVAAMGPLGVEGMFRRSCEITLRVLRVQSETLMSVLRPFVYDPMVTWRSSSARPPARKESVETTNELVCIKVCAKLNQSYEVSVFLSPMGSTESLDPMVTWRSTSTRPPARKESMETTSELVCIKVFTKLNESYQFSVFLPRWASTESLILLSLNYNIKLV